MDSLVVVLLDKDRRIVMSYNVDLDHPTISIKADFKPEDHGKEFKVTLTATTSTNQEAVLEKNYKILQALST